MEATKSNNFHEYIYPVIILTVIALVSTLLLAITNNATAPVIAERAFIEANANRQVVFPGASSFVEVAVDSYATSTDGSASVTEVYQAEDGSGYAMTCVTKSFGGNLTMMVGIDASGAITGVTVTDHSDTPGVGTKDQTPEYLGQYDGKTSLTAEDVKKESGWNYISGASVSGTAIHKGVYAALAQYAQLGGAQ